MWYDKQLLLSHNKVLNMVLSNRGGGKTYCMTKWCIADFLKNGNMAMWIRRYNTEIDTMLQNNKFFDAVSGEFEGHKLTVDGNIGYVDGEPFIYFVPLSTSRQLKSNNYPKVNKIIFDEFIIDKGRITYLKNEVEVFLDLFETVARTRDNVRAVLLANAVTAVNPYFLYFKISPNPNKRFNVYEQICVEFFTDNDFVEMKKKTRFGQLIAGTRYGNYAIDNKYLLDTDTFIAKKTPSAKFTMALKYNGNYLGFWVDYKAGYIFVNDKYDSYSYNIYCLQKEDLSPNMLLIKSINENRNFKTIVYGFKNSLLRFENQNIKSQFYEIMQLFVR